MNLPSKEQIDSLPAATVEKPLRVLISQRDFRTLEYLRHKLDPQHPVDECAKDHRETEWYRTYFAGVGRT